MKLCSHCKELKDESEFNANCKSSDGLDYRCKECVSDYQKRHYAKSENHLSKILSMRLWHRKNRLHKRKKDLEYYYNHHEERLAYDKEYRNRPDVIERRREYQRLYYHRVKKPKMMAMKN